MRHVPEILAKMFTNHSRHLRQSKVTIYIRINFGDVHCDTERALHVKR